MQAPHSCHPPKQSEEYAKEGAIIRPDAAIHSPAKQRRAIRLGSIFRPRMAAGTDDSAQNAATDSPRNTGNHSQRNGQRDGDEFTDVNSRKRLRDLSEFGSSRAVVNRSFNMRSLQA
jgi:hypothetical protein